VCPVDCIALDIVSGDKTAWDAWTPEQAHTAKTRYEARKLRLQREAAEHEVRLVHKAETKLADLAAHTKSDSTTETERKRAIIEAALAKARERQAAPRTPKP
jgi:electron transport complex protein RnfB